MEMMAEGAILETNEGGELQIPAGILGAGPHARFRVEHEGQALRLIPEASDRARGTTQPGDRVRVFHEWVTRLPKRGGPPLPAEELRRENFYD